MSSCFSLPTKCQTTHNQNIYPIRNYRASVRFITSKYRSFSQTYAWYLRPFPSPLKPWHVKATEGNASLLVFAFILYLCFGFVWFDGWCWWGMGGMCWYGGGSHAHILVPLFINIASACWREILATDSLRSEFEFSLSSPSFGSVL